MIRPLRRRHLWLVAVVAAVVAPIYLAALAARPAPAVPQARPAARPGGLFEPPASPVGVGIDLPTTPPIRVRPLAAGGLEATAEEYVEGPDLLLYWAPAGDSRNLADGYLLGALRGGERQLFQLPAIAAGTDGVLIVYSLGHREEVAAAPWPAGPEDRR